MQQHFTNTLSNNLCLGAQILGVGGSRTHTYWNEIRYICGRVELTPDLPATSNYLCFLRSARREKIDFDTQSMIGNEGIRFVVGTLHVIFMHGKKWSKNKKDSNTLGVFLDCKEKSDDIYGPSPARIPAQSIFLTHTGAGGGS